MSFELKAGLNAYLARLPKSAPARSLTELIEFNRVRATLEMPLFGQEWFASADTKGPLSDKAYRDALAATAKVLAATAAKDAVVALADVALEQRALAWRLQQATRIIADGAYRFDALKSVKDKKERGVKKLVLMIEAEIDAKSDAKAKSKPAPELDSAVRQGQAIATGMALAKDLGNLPGNMCTPAHLAETAVALGKEHKFEVEVLERADMEKLGMHSLLAVAAGSHQPPKLIVLSYRGATAGEKPVVLIGKGVTFDTGGISIKGSAGMEDMKGDMGGAACVVGLMHALAARKARVNVVGAIGVVENMPDGNAQRPGDIVTSMSGQTIEIINTDAEGRLVLADVLWYVATKFKPKFMVDLATLTGAIMVALGQEYAGLFSNNDELAGRLYDAGISTQERVWRMPLGTEYDKLIDSKTADMKNVGSPYGGACTAAAFLKRFVGDVPWAHLDIAGTAWGGKNIPYLDVKHASGYGVRLLTEWVLRTSEETA